MWRTSASDNALILSTPCWRFEFESICSLMDFWKHDQTPIIGFNFKRLITSQTVIENRDICSDLLIQKPKQKKLHEILNVSVVQYNIQNAKKVKNLNLRSLWSQRNQWKMQEHIGDLFCRATLRGGFSVMQPLSV